MTKDQAKAELKARRTAGEKVKLVQTKRIDYAHQGFGVFVIVEYSVKKVA